MSRSFEYLSRMPACTPPARSIQNERNGSVNIPTACISDRLVRASFALKGRSDILPVVCRISAAVSSLGASDIRTLASGCFMRYCRTWIRSRWYRLCFAGPLRIRASCCFRDNYSEDPRSPGYLATAAQIILVRSAYNITMRRGSIRHVRIAAHRIEDPT